MSIKHQIEINELRSRVEDLEHIVRKINPDGKKKPGPRKGWKSKKIEAPEESKPSVEGAEHG